MNIQQQTDYKRIADAIEFLTQNRRSQPSLDQAAQHVHLSPFHFQRMFSDWAGVTPKQFVQHLTAQHAKQVLKDTQSTLLDATIETGLSGTGRLHDLFIRIEGMTPGEYRNGGAQLTINYSFADTPFGKVLIASTGKGICHLAFADCEEGLAFDALQSQFPNAQYRQLVDAIQQNALFIFTKDWSRLDEIRLNLKGSPFQIRIWEALLKVPPGGLVTYGRLAENAGASGAARAVGSGVAANPVAFLIPCHRVIRSTGELGKYHWGVTRKAAIIGWEASRQHAGI